MNFESTLYILSSIHHRQSSAWRRRDAHDIEASHFSPALSLIPPCRSSVRSVTGSLQRGGGEMLLILRQAISRPRCHWFHSVDSQFAPSPRVFSVTMMSVLFCWSTFSLSVLSLSSPLCASPFPVLALSNTKSLKIQSLPFRLWFLVYFLSNINLFRQLFVAKRTLISLSLSQVVCNVKNNAKFSLHHSRLLFMYYSFIM